MSHVGQAVHQQGGEHVELARFHLYFFYTDSNVYNDALAAACIAACELIASNADGASTVEESID